MFIQKNTHYSLFLFIINVIKPFKWLIVGQFMVAVIWAIDMSLRPYLIKVILNKIPNILPSQAFDVLIPQAILYIFMSIVIVIIFRFYEWILLYLHPNLKKHIGVMLMGRMMNHSQNFYQNHFSGSIANKINDVSIGIPNILNIFIDRFCSCILGLLVAIYTVWLVDFKFAICLVLWIIIFLTISIKLSGKAKVLAHEAAEVNSMVVGNIIDILGNILSVRLFGSNIIEINYLNKNYGESVKVEQVRDWYLIKMHTFQKSSFIIFQSICFWWLITGIKSQTITAGDFALILILNISIVHCLDNLSNNIREFSQSFGKITQGLHIIYSILDIQDKKGAKDIVIKKGEIFFKKVQFYYVKSKPIFENKSVKIYSKQKIGVVGYSGSGKSTFVNLILRLFDVTQGQIMIDDQDIRDISQKSLREAISVIPQDLSLFNRTLMENIRYGRINASDDEVIEAAKRAHAHEFILNLSKGYKTLVGERGVKISGGERQRIAIARAILKNAPILILDEATSQLDSLTEQLMQESLRDLMQEKTTIIIAHRLSTLLHMDRILVFNQGKIIQDGKHIDLITEEGLYKTLWDAQVGGFLPETTTLR
jgi:ATP-binding cassette subfamily B protein